MAGLTRRDVEHVAHLARLGVGEVELPVLARQLNHILEQFAVLAEVDTDGIAPSAQVIELALALRDDEALPSLPLEAVLVNAPERAGDHIVVPAVLGDADRS